MNEPMMCAVCYGVQEVKMDEKKCQCSNPDFYPYSQFISIDQKSGHAYTVRPMTAAVKNLQKAIMIDVKE